MRDKQVTSSCVLDGLVSDKVTNICYCRCHHDHLPSVHLRLRLGIELQLRHCQRLNAAVVCSRATALTYLFWPVSVIEEAACLYAARRKLMLQRLGQQLFDTVNSEHYHDHQNCDSKHCRVDQQQSGWALTISVARCFHSCLALLPCCGCRIWLRICKFLRRSCTRKSCTLQLDSMLNSSPSSTSALPVRF